MRCCAFSLCVVYDAGSEGAENAKQEATVAGFSPGVPGEGKNLWQRRD